MKKLFLILFLSVLPGLSHADVLAAIELGSKGIKAIAIDYNGRAVTGEQTYKVLLREDIKADLIGGASDGFLSEKKIADAATAVATLFARLKSLDPQYFTIVGSTSIVKYNNFEVLNNAIADKVKLKNDAIKYITSDEEIFYALKASVRNKYLPKSILIDIGSGNTKIGYYSPMSPNGFESTMIDYGTKKLADKAIAAGGDYKSALKKIVQDEVSPTLSKAIQSQPGIASRQRKIYIEGGASWAVATYAHPELIEKPFTYLTLAEVEAVGNRFDREDLAIQAKTEAAEAAFLKIGDNFDPKQLQAGSTILRTILREIGAGQRTIVFNREGGWILGYIITEYNRKNNVDE